MIEYFEAVIIGHRAARLLRLTFFDDWYRPSLPFGIMFTVNYRVTRSDFQILFYFSMNIPLANRTAPDGAPRSGVTSGAILFAYVPFITKTCPCNI